MNRRLVLKMFAATSVSDYINSSAEITENPLVELDCTDLLARIRNGSVRVEQLCEAFLNQYEQQQALNVVTWIDRSSVLSRARNIDRARDKGIPLPALAGLPILVKDNIDTLGFPTSAGTASLKQHYPARSAPVVEHLLQQGAILFGKANMHELALGATSSNPNFGFVRNPYNPELIPGGSSGGSAAAISARIVPAALGTDTAGSVRIPAAFCGVVGFRPSTYPRRVYSQQGVVPHTPELDTIGPMGRSVADVAMLHRTIVGQRSVRPRSLRNARIGIPRLTLWEDLHPEVERVAAAAVMRLCDKGAVLVEIDLRQIRDVAGEILPAMTSSVVVELENFLRKRVRSVSLRDLSEQIASRDVMAALEKRAATGPDSDLLHARVRRDAICTAYRALTQQHGIQAMVFPTVALPPPAIRSTGDDPDEMIVFNGRTVSKVWTLLRNTIPAAILGLPALSLPAGLTKEGLPVALEFDGLPGHDSALLALGMGAEAAIGRLPPPALVLR